MSGVIARLVCVGQRHRENSRPIDVVGPAGNEVRVGRSKQCNVHCDDSMISNVHCRVYLKQRNETAPVQVWLEDCSSNGTFVNAQKVGKGRSVPLSHKDEIGLLVPCSGVDAVERPPFAFVCLLSSSGDGLDAGFVDLSQC